MNELQKLPGTGFSATLQQLPARSGTATTWTHRGSEQEQQSPGVGWGKHLRTMHANKEASSAKPLHSSPHQKKAEGNQEARGTMKVALQNRRSAPPLLSRPCDL